MHHLGEFNGKNKSFHSPEQNHVLTHKRCPRGTIPCHAHLRGTTKEHSKVVIDHEFALMLTSKQVKQISHPSLLPHMALLPCSALATPAAAAHMCQQEYLKASKLVHYTDCSSASHPTDKSTLYLIIVLRRSAEGNCIKETKNHKLPAQQKAMSIKYKRLSNATRREKDGAKSWP